MPLFGGKKKEKKQESSSAGNSLSNNLVTETSSSRNGISHVTTSRVIQSSSLHTTFTETRREERSISGNLSLLGSSLGSSSFPRFDQTRLSLHETRSDGNFRSNNTSLRPLQYRNAFSGSTFGTYSSASPLSRVAASSSQPSILGGDGVRRSGPNIPRLSVPSSTTFINNNEPSQPQTAPIRFGSSTVLSSVPVYQHSSPRRGKVLMINNIKFLSQKHERIGAEKDHNDLKNLFKKLNFEVEDYKNLTSKQMNGKIKSFSKSPFKTYNMSIVVMMSHGTNRDAAGNIIRGGYTNIFGSDDLSLNVDDILDYFSGDKSKDLKGKPKIFIFQCCRGELDETLAYDARPIGAPDFRMHEDMLLAFSTLPGFLSNRNPAEGSWYIQSIVETFDEHYKNHSIEDMLKIADQKLSTKHPKYKQTSTYENRGFKVCFLVPQV